VLDGPDRLPVMVALRGEARFGKTVLWLAAMREASRCLPDGRVWTIDLTGLSLSARRQLVADRLQTGGPFPSFGPSGAHTRTGSQYDLADPVVGFRNDLSIDEIDGRTTGVRRLTGDGMAISCSSVSWPPRS
jgi:hypothetical protein